MLTMMVILILGQAADAYPRTYQTAQQCAVMATTIGLARDEPETGPMRRLGQRANLLAAELAPANMTPQQFATDAVNIQNMLFTLTGRPGEPGFAQQIEALAPEVEKCRAMLDRR